MEPLEYKKNEMEDNFSDLGDNNKTEEDVNDNVSLSRIRVKVRRQDSSMEEVYLGKFDNAKKHVDHINDFRG